jgi:hypothetical protein
LYRHTVRAKHRAFLSRHTAASARHLGFSLGLLFGLFFFLLLQHIKDACLTGHGLRHDLLDTGVGADEVFK